MRAVVKAGIEPTPDAKIVSCALTLGPQTEFITNDLSCKTIAKLFLKNVSSFGEKDEEDYTGYKEITMSDEEMCEFYSDLSENRFGLLKNEYLIIRDSTGTIVDSYCWTGIEHRRLKTRSFFSDYLGEVKAIKGDIYQKMAADSLANNQLTVLRGCAGSGKSYLGLGYLLSQLDGGKIDKIVMFVNPVATKDSCKFGFLPGTLEEKILGSQIGSFLSSKLGGIDAVYRLINDQKLEFVAIADARGYDTTGMNCGLYLTEAQNTTIDMMKLLLERIGEDTICVIEGDDEAQVDYTSYEGANNGLHRLCEVFKGELYFGTVTLKICHRSKIAKKALEM